MFTEGADIILLLAKHPMVFFPYLLQYNIEKIFSWLLLLSWADVTKCSIGESDVRSSPNLFLQNVSFLFCAAPREQRDPLINEVGDLVIRPEKNSWCESLPLREFAE